MIGFMIWIWLSTIVLLVGGKLNAEIERCPYVIGCHQAGEGQDHEWAFFGTGPGILR